MYRMWYLSRSGQVFGPVADAQLAQWVAAGQVLPTDQLNVAGQPNWVLASAIPGLLPPPQPLSLDPEPLSLDDDPAPAPAVTPKRSIRVTCFACFEEVVLEFAAGTATAPCPSCRAALETGETPSTAAAPAGAFAALESPAAFKERMQKKAIAAQGGPEQANNGQAATIASIIFNVGG
jgi:hypothetical protein